VNLNYCGVCGEFLGPDDFDGICPECDRKLCEGCGELMVVDGVDDDGEDRYRCPFCEPATEAEVKLNGEITRANDEIGELSKKLFDANGEITALRWKVQELADRLTGEMGDRGIQLALATMESNREKYQELMRRDPKD